jgi:hypothetical protein
MVRRVATVVIACVCLFALSAVGAQAAATKSVSYTLTGSAQWNALDLPSSFTVSGQVSDGGATIGTYSGTFLAGTFASCPDNPYGPLCAPVTGDTITFALKNGSITAAVQPGSTVWQLFTGPSQDVYAFELSLTVTGGTRAYAHAQGTLSLLYRSIRDNLYPDPTGAPCSHNGVATCPIFDIGTVTGTITHRHPAD